MSRAVKNVRPIKTVEKPYTTIIIVAAGQAKRMNSYGPRSLIKLRPDYTLIEHQIHLIRQAFTKYNIILVAGHEANKVMNNTETSIIKIENENFAETSVIRSIGMGLRATLTEYVLIIYGDVFFNINTINVPYDNGSFIIYDKDKIDNEGVGCTINDQGYLENMFYGLKNRWAEMVFLTGKELKEFQKIAWNVEKYRLFGFEAINEVIEKNGKFITYSPAGMIAVDIDCAKDIEKVKEYENNYQLLR